MPGYKISDKNRYRKGAPFTLSRAAIEEFVNCPCCFCIKRREGIKPRDSFPLSLNNHIDSSLKDLFDTYRNQRKNHPLMANQLERLGIHTKAIPYYNVKLNEWRTQAAGLQCKLPGSNITLLGLPDDIWYDPDTNELIIVDYKATSKRDDVTLDGERYEAYKRQVTIYQYILQQMINNNPDKFPGMKVSKIAFFVYLNGTTEGLDILNQGMQFTTSLLPFDRREHPDYCDDNWVYKVAKTAIDYLDQDGLPPINDKCDSCLERMAWAQTYKLNTNEVKRKKYKVRKDKSKKHQIATLSTSQELEDAKLEKTLSQSAAPLLKQSNSSSSSSAAAVYNAPTTYANSLGTMYDRFKDIKSSSFEEMMAEFNQTKTTTSATASFLPIASSNFGQSTLSNAAFSNSHHNKSQLYDDDLDFITPTELEHKTSTEAFGIANYKPMNEEAIRAAIRGENPRALKRTTEKPQESDNLSVKKIKMSEY